MRKGLEIISSKEYPGRMILIGQDPVEENDVIVYAITGRSPSSQKRKIVTDKALEFDAIKTVPTDPTAIEKGIPALLIYNCIRVFQDNLIVSNGAQTDIIYDTVKSLVKNGHSISPAEVFVEAFKKPHEIKGDKQSLSIDLTRFEPDCPHFTPRISGIITRKGAALHIVKNVEGHPIKHIFEIPLLGGRGKGITTYTGRNVRKGEKIPSFEGDPFDVVFQGKTTEEVARDVYEALGPKEEGLGVISPGADFRVGVAVAFYKRSSNQMNSFIINREKGGE